MPPFITGQDSFDYSLLSDNSSSGEQMCGLAGILAPTGERAGERLGDIAERMASTLTHRGPDDSGVWSNEDEGFAVGHRRLAIIDLSPAGKQPMTSRSGRYVLAYNGELYNFLTLRRALTTKGHSFHGSSDTEVLLACVDEWGITGALEALDGMFAFALWDRESKTLSLARDRLGEKPLYYGKAGNRFIFGSELRSLARAPGFSPELNRSAFALLLRHKYIPAPYSAFANVRKLEPGCVLRVRSGTTIRVGSPVSYWSARAEAQRGLRETSRAPYEDLVDELERLLLVSVERRMLSDVPLGAFLSGGIDSSTVVSIMAEVSAQPVRTFTIGFESPELNEAPAARAVANHLGTDHSELVVTAADALNVVPQLATMFDEPFADASQIPTFLVSALARKSVTVALSGDGGDELFGGYSRYALARRILRATEVVPGSRHMASLLAPVVDGLLDTTGRLLPTRIRGRQLGWLFAASGHKVPRPRERLYEELVSDWHEPLAAVRGSEVLPTALNDSRCWIDGTFSDHMMFTDSVTYLPDDILAKVDRASMAVGLETRLPLLDHHIFEFAWRLPPSARVKAGNGKRILKDVLYRRVPPQLVNRSKQGFGVPLAEWLRGSLADWADDLLSPTALDRTGVFEQAVIRERWRQHRSGERNWHYSLWNVLMAQAWVLQNVQTGS